MLIKILHTWTKIAYMQKETDSYRDTWSSSDRLDLLLLFDTGSLIYSIYGMDQLCHCECGRCGMNKELQGHKKWSCGSGSWMLPQNTEFCAVFVSSFEMPVLSLEMTELCPLKLSALCCSPEPNCLGRDLRRGNSGSWWCLTLGYTKASYTLQPRGDLNRVRFVSVPSL